MIYLLLVSSLFPVSTALAVETPPAPVAVEVTPLEVTLLTLPHESAETADSIRYLFERATAEGKDPVPMAKTIYCESQWYNIQSGITTNGVREESYGLAQIHIPSHPDITKEQAMDPHFAIDYIVDHFDTDTWYGYNREKDECNNSIDEYWK